eukprot:CAMPEP_0117681532 /NCGR_PEP_ID=MMETSP0804-20121206/19042_1 /TAXON_ID=1074897 /ORGANISM="Tetraselmis astigmatica, Strain CCMP880" /LENGTH=226 /DNA_ID=CAMNT_0005491315 /DNA_START=185 /DNA_END=863 /DNA_ORIENTATION=+
MSRSAAIDSSAAAATTASAPPPAPSHSLGPLWPLGALLGLVYVHQEGVQVQAVWQDEVSDVVAAHAHMVQRDGVLAARHKLDGLQMRVHRHIYASDCALDDGPVLELDLDRLVGEFHQKADELHHPAKERRALANPSPVCLLLDRHRYWLGGDEAAQQIASRGQGITRSLGAGAGRCMYPLPFLTELQMGPQGAPAVVRRQVVASSARETDRLQNPPQATVNGKSN